MCIRFIRCDRSLRGKCSEKYVFDTLNSVADTMCCKLNQYVHIVGIVANDIGGLLEQFDQMTNTMDELNNLFTLDDDESRSVWVHFYTTLYRFVLGYFLNYGCSSDESIDSSDQLMRLLVKEEKLTSPKHDKQQGYNKY